MKKILAIIALMTVSCLAGNLRAGENEGVHYPANNCEIFIDKIGTQRLTDHGVVVLNIWVKTLNSRLDSEIAEVGFRNNKTEWAEDVYVESGFKNVPLSAFFGASDYFKITLMIINDYADMQYEGAFYVRTRKGTTYWFKDGNNKDFTFNDSTVKKIVEITGRDNLYSDSVTDALSTNSAIPYFNPMHCQ